MYRDQRGVEVWGQKRWRELLLVEARSVAKHRQRPACPVTGVYHYERPSGSMAWIAAWYALTADGSRKKRSAQFITYGTGISRYASSDDAMHAAIATRKEEEARWNCVLGERDKRQVNQ